MKIRRRKSVRLHGEWGRALKGLSAGDRARVAALAKAEGVRKHEVSRVEEIVRRIETERLSR